MALAVLLVLHWPVHLEVNSHVSILEQFLRLSLLTATVTEATAQATAYTHLGIENATSVGHGFGPLNHLHSITKLPIPQ